MTNYLNRKNAFIAFALALLSINMYLVLSKDAMNAKWIILAFLAVNVIFFISIYFAFSSKKLGESHFFDDQTTKILLIAILASALATRIILCLNTTGLINDVWCFVGWSQYAAENGFSTFYTGMGFADYPPGYIYIITIFAKIINLMRIDPYSPLGVFIVTLPSILCDIGIAFFAYKLAKKHGNKIALLTTAAISFLPVLILDGAVWKQVDSVFILVALLALYLLINKKHYASCLVFALAVLIKPQALILGPVYAVTFLMDLLDKTQKPVKVLLRTAFCGALSIGSVFLASLPFKGTQTGLWLLDKYFGTMKGYPYASVNAANMYTMQGFNYKGFEEKIGILTVSQISFIAILVLIVLVVLFCAQGQKRKSYDLILMSAFFMTGIFTFAEAMHERYSVVCVVLLIFAFINSLDKRILRAGIFQSILAFGNMLCVYLSGFNGDSSSKFSFGSTICFLGFLQVLVFIYIFYICLDTFTPIVDKLRKTALVQNRKVLLLNDEKAAPLRWIKKDTILILVPTLIALIMSFVNLGDFKTPVTTTQITAGQEYSVWFKDGKIPQEAWVFGEISNGDIIFSDTENENVIGQLELRHTGTFVWSSVFLENETEKITITGDNIKINEIAFVDENGIYIRPQGYTENAAQIFDEQYLKPQYRTYKSGMYFDEIYHARTAYEQINGLPIYETTHPPFGKVLIELGIMIFGMSPFGWRFFGTLIGVMLVPLMYLLARKLFKSRAVALFCQLLLLFDCMRFAQSRIATIDTPTVFFIMLSYLAMLYFIEKDFNKDKVTSYILPLLGCGVAFGFGCATKWTGIYSGAGLAVIFFSHLYKSYKQAIDKTVFKKRFIGIIGCGVAFFVAIPLVIYLLSYIPVYINSETPFTLKAVYDNQISMFSYHSQLTATHGYSSQWWSWPLSLRPVWYSIGANLPTGTASTISVMGNIAVWYTAFVAVLAMIWAKVKGAKSSTATFLLVAMAAQYLPWVFITRATFLYHYFTCLPFVILALGWLIQKLKQAYPNIKKLAFGIVTVSMSVFIIFYPVISGMIVSESYIRFLEWLPQWTFLGW